MKYKNFAELSNTVGWTGTTIPIPQEKDIKKAIEDKDELLILKWWRYCSYANNVEERRLHRMIYEAFNRIVIEGYKGTENTMIH